MEVFKGACTALVTPITEDGKEVNYNAFKKLIDSQIKAGISALVFLGTTGEPSTLSQEERTSVIKFAVEYVKGRVPVIAGAGSNSTHEAIEKSKLYESMGADALLHVTPYYNKCTQKGLIEHFTQVANNVKIPIILYNVPGRTGVNMLPKTVEALSRHKNIVAVKEASANVDQVSEIARICPKDFAIYSGEDGIVLPLLSLGGKGVISVASNVVPKEMSELCSSYFSGNIEKCREIQFKLRPLVDALFCEVNPIPVKTALNLMGQNAGALRLPLTEMEPATKEKLQTELKNLKLI